MRKFVREHRKLITFLSGFVLIFGASLALSHFLSPSPPKTLVFTAGAPDGAYFKFAQQYKALLAKEGIDLEVLPSAGSVQNIRRLEDGKERVFAGFVQGGLGILSRDHDPAAKDFEAIQSLANVAYEPVWIFSRHSHINDLKDFKGLKIAIGAPGSGTRKVALDILQASGLEEKNEQWLPLGGSAANQALKDKSIDVVFSVASPQAPSVQQLVRLPGVQLVELTHANAISRLYPYLRTITLPKGVMDLPQQLPTKDQTLLATSANLVVSERLHPALAFLLLDAAAQVHRGGGELHRPGDFPHTKGTDYPLADEAKRYFLTGKPFLQRYMPFWLANFVQRLLLVLIPLLAVVVPIVKLFPEILKWQQERKLFKIYDKLTLVENKLLSEPCTDDNKVAYIAMLDDIDARINATKFSKAFADRVYTLREHVGFVRSGVST